MLLECVGEFECQGSFVGNCWFYDCLVFPSALVVCWRKVGVCVVWLEALLPGSDYLLYMSTSISRYAATSLWAKLLLQIWLHELIYSRALDVGHHSRLDGRSDAAFVSRQSLSVLFEYFAKTHAYFWIFWWMWRFTTHLRRQSVHIAQTVSVLVHRWEMHQCLELLRRVDLVCRRRFTRINHLIRKLSAPWPP